MVLRTLKQLIRDLDSKQFETLWKAIEQFEGWQPGNIRREPKPLGITRVMKNKKQTIVAYLIDKLGWVMKAQAIELARDRKIDAVVAHSRSGNLYLRTRPDIKVTNNLNLLG